MSGVRLLTIADGDQDQRFDRWLKRQFPLLRQGEIEKLCRKGAFRLDGARVKPNARVKLGQTVRVPPLNLSPEVERAERQPKSVSRIAPADLEMLRHAILFEDDDILVFNKPPGLPSQGGSGQNARHVDALVAGLVAQAAEKPRLLHRLDKDTSGVLVLAKSREMAHRLSKTLQAKQTRKIYWAAVAGVPVPKAGSIRYGLLKSAGHGAMGEAEKMRCILPQEVAQTAGAKHAHSDYAVLSMLARRAAWVAMVPITGRTHQLRAHMAQMGNPIIGDGKYGGSGQENLGEGWGAQLGGGLSRKLHLHARALFLRHPRSGKPLQLIAPLPRHMQESWNFFGWDVEDVPLDPFDLDAENGS